MFALSVFHRDRLVGRSTFDQEEVRIGRSADNEVHLDNLGVSRYHASIASVDGVHILKDFGSDNGTFVNGDRVIGRRALDDGDRIQLSKFLIVFRGPRASVERVDIRDQASFALAGQTIVTRVPPAVLERRCPFTAYIELEQREAPPRIHRLETDACVLGPGADSDVVVPAGATGAPRAAVILRGWSGFSILPLDQGVRRNKVPLVARAPLASRDELSFGPLAIRFFVTETEAAP